MHFVGNAKLVQAANHSEMRIAMDTDKLGPVELRARVVGDEVGAAITVEKRDAHAALAVELPTLQQALSEKQLRVDQVTLVHGSLHSTSGDAGAASRQQDQRQGASGSAMPWSSSAPASVSSGYGITFGSESAAIFDSQGRLSVHA
jgi:flagellar hook-length control protein FliK